MDRLAADRLFPELLHRPHWGIRMVGWMEGLWRLWAINKNPRWGDARVHIERPATTTTPTAARLIFSPLPLRCLLHSTVVLCISVSSTRLAYTIHNLVGVCRSGGFCVRLRCGRGGGDHAD